MVYDFLDDSTKYIIDFELVQVRLWKCSANEFD
jgi:hypothetical protein